MTMPSHKRFARAPQAALAFTFAVVLILACFGQSRLYYDYAWQLMSVRDYAQGQTANPFVMRLADPADLTRDRDVWTIGYPLAYNAAGTVLTAAGLSPAHAHRTIAVSAVLLGVLGWYFVLQGCTTLPPVASALTLIAISLSYNGALMVTFMMPEVFLFTTVPWQLWALWQATDPATNPGRRLRLCGGLGVITGLAYTFRYLAALHGLALLAAAAVWLLRHRPSRWVACGIALACCAALPVIALSLLNFSQTGAIHSVSSSQPWGFTPRWPDVNQWLLVLIGPVQALFGASHIFTQAAEFIQSHGLALPSHGAWITLNFALAIPTTLAVVALLVRFAPRNRLMAFALAGLTATGGGLLWLYSRSTIPQTDPRYFVAVAWMFLPNLVMALYALWHHHRVWWVVLVTLLVPSLLALPAAAYSAALSLAAREPEGPDGLVAGGRVDPEILQAAVRARLPAPGAEIVWMCFQPGVLQALAGRHLCESYLDQPVTYRASRPVNLVVLRDRPPAMHPAVYHNNHQALGLDTRIPDLQLGVYDVFLCLIGPDGPMPVPAKP